MSALRTDGDEPEPPPLRPYDPLVWRWVTYTYDDGEGRQSTSGYAAIHPDDLLMLTPSEIGNGMKALVRDGHRAILAKKKE